MPEPPIFNNNPDEHDNNTNSQESSGRPGDNSINPVFGTLFGEIPAPLFRLFKMFVILANLIAIDSQMKMINACAPMPVRSFPGETVTVIAWLLIFPIFGQFQFLSGVLFYVSL